MSVKKRKIELCLALTMISFFISVSVARAASYYVDRTNAGASDGNAGTESRPWATIQHAADSVASGDTVYVKTGTYNESIKLKTSGSAGRYITFRNYPGHKPIIDGSSTDAQKLIDWKGPASGGTRKNYIIFDGFKVKNAPRWAFWVEGDHTIIRNCTIHDTGHTGIIVLDSDHTTISSNHIYNTGWNGMSLESCNYSTVEYNVSHDNLQHFGINIFPKTNWPQTMETGNNIRYNVLYGNMGGIYTRYQKDNEIIGNLIYKNREYGIFFHANTAAGGASEYAGRTKVYHNTVADNTKGGIYNVNATHLSIKGNIFAYHAIQDFRYELQMNKTEGHAIDYNLYYTIDPAGEFVYWGGLKYDLAGFRAATAHSNHDQFAEPKFAGRSRDNYRLTAGSPGIDACTEPMGVAADLDGNPRPQGASDQGCYELPKGEVVARQSLDRELQLVSFQ
ncbi:MAG: right-handed parallel beta-helix repeat-containing protein [Desulfobacteraceae bacterium]|nr:MAG: right-handed parallel beta-helix repeat-containing protein [Desulfobacteraceae bacterium]